MRADWVEVELGKVFDIVSGNTPKELKDIQSNGGIPFFKVSDMNTIGNEVFMYSSGLNLSEETIKKLKLKIYPEGTILFPKRGGAILTNKKRVLLKKSCFDLNIMGVLPNSWVLSKFLYYWFLQIDLGEICDGSNVPQINNKNIYPLTFHVIPVPEQRAIVAKIDELFSELDNGIANLKAAQAKLDIYRQAVLKQAFEGELTREWREKQTDLPSADKCLERIKQSRFNYYESLLKKWENNKFELSKPKKPQYYPVIDKESLDDLPSIPKEWRWEKLGNVCLKIMDGTHFSPENLSSGDFMYVTAKNIKEGKLDLNNISYVTNKDHKEIYSRCDVEQGDVLYIKDGATTGRAVVNPLKQEFSLLSSVGVFKLDKALLVPKFLEYYLNAKINRNRMLNNIAGVAITRLTLVKLNNAEFILCSVEEQNQIVQEIEARLSVCDKLAETIQTSLQQAEALRQSILKKAFEGRLLTETELQTCKAQADWMPAEQLLAQIKSTKAKG